MCKESERCREGNKVKLEMEIWESYWGDFWSIYFDLNKVIIIN